MAVIFRCIVVIVTLVAPGLSAAATIICDGNCPSVDLDGNLYDLTLAIQTMDGDDLTLTVDGDVYVRGPVSVDGTITLYSSSVDIGSIDTLIDPGLVIDGDATIDPGGLVVIGASGTPSLFATASLVAPLSFDVTGDVYLDVSSSQLANLWITSTGIIFFGSEPLPVPEPGTALLVGAGLALLTGRRRRPA